MKALSPCYEIVLERAADFVFFLCSEELDELRNSVALWRCILPILRPVGLNRRKILIL